jgi:hypothetical protein
MRSHASLTNDKEANEAAGIAIRGAVVGACRVRDIFLSKSSPSMFLTWPGLAWPGFHLFIYLHIDIQPYLQNPQNIY